VEFIKGAVVEPAAGVAGCTARWGLAGSLGRRWLPDVAIRNPVNGKIALGQGEGYHESRPASVPMRGRVSGMMCAIDLHPQALAVIRQHEVWKEGNTYDLPCA